jgi:hypothetical protein
VMQHPLTRFLSTSWATSQLRIDYVATCCIVMQLRRTGWVERVESCPELGEENNPVSIVLPSWKIKPQVRPGVVSFPPMARKAATERQKALWDLLGSSQLCALRWVARLGQWDDPGENRERFLGYETIRVMESLVKKKLLKKTWTATPGDHRKIITGYQVTKKGLIEAGPRELWAFKSDEAARAFAERGFPYEINGLRPV